MLGPLYHLCALQARRQAVTEAARILKPGGLLFAAGINRLTYLRDFFRLFPHVVSRDRKAFHEQYLRDGNLDAEHAPPIGLAHLSTYAEFRALFAPEFEELALAGVESFSAVVAAHAQRSAARGSRGVAGPDRTNRADRGRAGIL
jgi:SAM-dependent methyltransferase